MDLKIRTKTSELGIQLLTIPHLSSEVIVMSHINCLFALWKRIIEGEYVKVENEDITNLIPKESFAIFYEMEKEFVNKPENPISDIDIFVEDEKDVDRIIACALKLVKDSISGSIVCDLCSKTIGSLETGKLTAYYFSGFVCSIVYKAEEFPSLQKREDKIPIYDFFLCDLCYNFISKIEGEVEMEYMDFNFSTDFSKIYSEMMMGIA